MKGAMALPPPITINIPKSKRTIITGDSQNFLRSFKNCHMSTSMSMSVK